MIPNFKRRVARRDPLVAEDYSSVPDNISEKDVQIRQEKLIHAIAKANQHRRPRDRDLENDQERETNQEFYRGCDVKGKTKRNVDTFVLSYAYDLYTARGVKISDSVTDSIRTLDELVEYYVIEYLDVGDCAIEGLYMVDRTPADHAEPNAAHPCPSTDSMTCTPVAGGLTVEYNAEIVSRYELADLILDAIEYGMDHDKLVPQQSAIRGTVFMGPEHTTVAPLETLVSTTDAASGDTNIGLVGGTAAGAGALILLLGLFLAAVACSRGKRYAKDVQALSSADSMARKEKSIEVDSRHRVDIRIEEEEVNDCDYGYDDTCYNNTRDFI